MYYDLGRALEKAGRLDAAMVAETRRVAEREMRMPGAPVAWAWSAHKTGDSREALGVLQRGLGHGHEEDSAAIHNHICYISRGAAKAKEEKRKAALLCQEAASAHPNRPEIWSNLALALEANEDPAAGQAFRTACELDPLSASSAFRSAVHQHRRKELVGATRDYRTATRLDPQHGPAYFNWGLALETGGATVQQRMEIFHAAAAVEPTNGRAWHKTGALFAQSCELEQAVVALQRSLALQPGALHVYDDLAVALWSSGATASAQQQRTATAKQLTAFADSLKGEGRESDGDSVAAKAALFSPGAGAAGVARLECAGGSAARGAKTAG